jgi:hypothetical protein
MEYWSHHFRHKRLNNWAQATSEINAANKWAHKKGLLLALGLADYGSDNCRGLISTYQYNQHRLSHFYAMRVSKQLNAEESLGAVQGRNR